MLILATSNVFSLAYSQSDPFGKVVILSLVLLSMVCWMTLIYKLWMVYQVSRLSRYFEGALKAQKAPLLTLDASSFPALKAQGSPHPFHHIFFSVKGKTIDLLNKNQYFLSQGGSSSNAYLTANDLNVLEAYGLMIISSQNNLLERYLFILPTIVTLAPFLGLLGTVWGILETFTGLQGGGSLGSSSAILGGISTALATTVLGLIIAIPALIGSNYLKNYLKRYLSEMDDFLTLIISQIEIQYRKVE
ncbi:MAG: MotA/TolQ/ExbB proton channel family protein [Candidatus Rhabdochlamydia sp.]